ncbi:MAG: glycosyltransferase family 2 protein [Deltaproteobacteria bacterium]|nr:glycosyltransferase family 2 protein [Deltaproteobacteria bacterium]
MDLSFIIINWNTRKLLLDCLQSIPAAACAYQYEVIVVDNGSDDRSPEAVKHLADPRIHLIENRQNLGFAAANNQALRQARGAYLVLLNSDTIVFPETVQGLITFMDTTPTAAMAGPRMVGGDGRLQNSYDNFPSLVTELLNKSLLRLLMPHRFAGKTASAEAPFEVDSLIGACIAVRSTALKQVGLLDEDYFFFLEETDWCLRMRRQGWKIFHLPQVKIVHLQGQSKKKRPALSWIEYYRSLYIFFRKNRSRASYYTLRTFRFAKLVINLLLTLLGLCLTCGIKARHRDKTAVYARLIWWHLRLCPDGVGLRKDNKQISSQESRVGRQETANNNDPRLKKRGCGKPFKVRNNI